MKINKTERGFKIIEFKDYYDQECSLQESSLIKPCIWLGVDVGLEKKQVSNRMHLNQTQVKKILPYLIYFAEHGCLPDNNSEIK